MDSNYNFNYYGGGGDEAEQSSDDGGDAEPDFAYVISVEKRFKILKEEDIKRLQEKDISSVSDVLSVSRGGATALLCRHNWNLNAVYDNWFSDEHVRKSSQKSIPEKEICKICYEKIKKREKTMLSCSCGHPFCSDCWKTYITTSIDDGPGCLTLLCPEPDCKVFVGSDMIESLVFGDYRTKFDRYLNRSYVESTRNRKWCPAPGCEYAVEFELSCDGYDVMCDCSYKFCWNCMGESHSPVDCRTVMKWIEKNSSEEENMSYILAYTKPCPKCQKAIEKNLGCNHMTCRRPCGHEFCWTCLGPWKNLHECNAYKEKQDVSELEESRKNARKNLEKYTHYFERWDANDKSRKRAMLDLGRVRNEHVDKLVKVQAETRAQVEFVIDAWEQIVECRRVLKWTYVYGYYLKPEKIEFFGYLQGEAEFALERLHHCAEKEMKKYLRAECPSKDFKDYRTKLGYLTTVTRNYFENLVRALENNLSES